MTLRPLKIPYHNDNTVEEIRLSTQSHQSHRQQHSMDLEQALRQAKMHPKPRINIPQQKRDLKKIVSKHKKTAMVKNFVSKLRATSTHRKPIQEVQEADEQIGEGIKFQMRKFCTNIGSRQGLKIGNGLLVLWSFANIIQITLMVFIFSIMLAFPETSNFSLFLKFRIFSFSVYVVDMVLNFITQRYEKGRLLLTIGQISTFYLNNGFIIDIISILIFPIDLMADSYIANFISFVAIFKLVNNMKKLEKFEYMAINNTQKQQYFGLVKVILTNFTIGHILSIILNLMVEMDHSTNWHIVKGIEGSSWFVKYIWGYYWGTNIMLTVGFGDLSATNYYEAIVLIFVQTFSCITLAYNISYVGALIGEIRKDEEEKKKKLKTFHQMCQQNQIEHELESKVCNFIEEEYRIKEQFQYEDHDLVLESLPKSIQKQFRVEANKLLFDGLGFLSNLSNKSLLNLAENVTRKICHPEEIIYMKDHNFDFVILQKGIIGLACKINSELDGKVIEEFDASIKKKPIIISLDFIKNKTIPYNVKSMSYSVLYFLTREEFMESIQPSDMDYQLFCVIRDKMESSLNENNLYSCPFCRGEFHNKFECSKLHYTPIRQIVMMKSVHKGKSEKQKRRTDFTRQKSSNFPLYQSKFLKQDQKKFFQENFDEAYNTQVENIHKFYEKLRQKPNMTLAQLNKYSMVSVHLDRASNNNLPKNVSRKQTMRARQPTIQGNKDTIQMMKFQQMLEMHTNRNNQKNADFWEIEIDFAFNFKYYFASCNPQKLAKVSLKKKKGMTQMVKQHDKS